MWRFSAGPSKTISRSCWVSSQNGTSVRTPISRATCFMRSHISEPQGSTAPWSMLSDSSGTRAARFTVRTSPVPWQVGQAPPELNERSSAAGPKKLWPHAGQVKGCSAATARLGSQRAPQAGHTCDPTRENNRRRPFKSSDMVPKVLRGPGMAGRWCRASAAGT